MTALDLFRRDVLPEIEANPGFCAVRAMLNRQTGEGIIRTVWADKALMDAPAEAAQARRQRAVQQGVTFGEQTKREIIFADMR